MPGPYKRGAGSAGELATCHHDLQIIAGDLLEGFDHSIYQGARTVEEQIRNILRGASKTIDSFHIPRDADGLYDPSVPCLAMDALPYSKGINPWPMPEDSRKLQTMKANRFYYMQGLIRKIAENHGIEIVQGVDWDMDGDFFDQKFHDLPHIQLVRLDWAPLVLPTELLEQANEALRSRGLRPYVNP
jgi:hypothetical protein